MAEDFEEYRDMVHRLIAIAEYQHTINERLTAAVEGIQATQADIKMLLSTLIERSANGRGGVH